MKTRFVFAVAGAMIVALAGCTGGSSNSNSPGTNTSANATSTLVRSQISAQRQTDMASLNQAIQTFRAAEGRYPDKLEDLTPNYIANIPQVPAGFRINYNASSGLVSLAHE